MANRPIHIALPWHNLGDGNLGVDALSQANIAILRAAAERAGRTARFTTLCALPMVRDGELPADVTIGPLPSPRALLTGKSPYLAVLRDSDLVVDIGEGDSWSDIYGNTRFAFQAGTKAAALALGKPLVLAPQTIGPFAHPVRRRIADALMNRARAVFSRDGLSTAYMASRKLKSDTAEFIDVAFRLPFTQAEKAGDRVRVGINVSGLLYMGGYTRANEFGMTIDYVDYSHRLIEAMLARGAEVHLILHVLGEGVDDDQVPVPALTTRYSDLKVSPAFRFASEAKSYMSGLDFVVGGRMHATIGAFSARVPVVPVAYSRKFNGLYDTLGYPHYVDGRALDTDTALTRTLAAFDDRPRLAADIDTGLALAQARLKDYEDRLVAILKTLP